MNIKENLLVTLKVSGIKSTDGDKLSSPVETYFTTRMTPMLATANDVRRRIGAYISNVKDDTIAQLNFINTQAAYNLGTLCDTTDPEWLDFSSRWVVLLTAITLLDNSEIFTNAYSGSVSKLLGDFEVTKSEPKSEGLKDLLDRLECELFKLELAVRLCQKPRSHCLALTNPKLAAADYNPSLPGLVTRGSLDINRPLAGRRWTKGDVPIAPDKVKAFGRWYQTFLGAPSKIKYDIPPVY